MGYVWAKWGLKTGEDGVCERFVLAFFFSSVHSARVAAAAESKMNLGVMRSASVGSSALLAAKAAAASLTPPESTAPSSSV